MTRTELKIREAELLSEIDDLGDMHDEGMLSEAIYNEEHEMVCDELKNVRDEMEFLNGDFSAVQRYD